MCGVNWIEQWGEGVRQGGGGVRQLCVRGHSITVSGKWAGEHTKGEIL